VEAFGEVVAENLTTGVGDVVQLVLDAPMAVEEWPPSVRVVRMIVVTHEVCV
jgi:hypothetical protein